MALVEVSIDQACGTLVLNNPEKRNALSSALIASLVAGLDVLREKQARVAVLRTPKATRTWSAGHDISELPTNGEIRSRTAILCGKRSERYNNFPPPS